MRRRTFWILVGMPLALITLAAGTAVALPAARHLASALVEPAGSLAGAGREQPVFISSPAPKTMRMSRGPVAGGYRGGRGRAG